MPHGAPERQRRYTAGVEHNCIAPRAPTPQRHALHVALEHTYRRRHASWRCGVRRLSCLRCSSADASPAAQAESRAARSLPPAWPHTASLCAPGLGGNELAGGAGGAPLSQCSVAAACSPFPASYARLPPVSNLKPSSQAKHFVTGNRNDLAPRKPGPYAKPHV